MTQVNLAINIRTKNNIYVFHSANSLVSIRGTLKLNYHHGTSKTTGSHLEVKLTNPVICFLQFSTAFLIAKS